MSFTVILEGGTPWGFRLQGGREFKEPIRIAKINPNSKAYVEGVQVGDYVQNINGQSTNNVLHNEALQLIKHASDRLELQLERGGINRHTPIPEIRVNGPVNGDINHNTQHLNGGSSKSQSYKPVSFNKPSKPVTSLNFVNSSTVSSSSPMATSPGSPTLTSKSIMSVSMDSTRVNGQPADLNMNGVAHPSPSSLSSTSVSLTSPPSSQVNTSPMHDSWSPSKSHEVQSPDSRSADSSLHGSIAPVWSPGGSQATRKEYKPVKLDTTAGLIRPTPADEPMDTPSYKSSGNSQPWTPSESPAATSTSTTTLTTSSASQSVPTTSTSSSSTWNGSISHFSETRSGLPSTQSPTITLLQKSREGQIPKGAMYVGSKETLDGDMKHTDTFYLLPSEERETTTKTVEKKAPKYLGAGPMDRTGMPVGLRTSVDSQKEWYRKMYKSLHETGKPKKKKVPTATLR